VAKQYLTEAVNMIKRFIRQDGLASKKAFGEKE
jgi:hypothetical protein